MTDSNEPTDPNPGNQPWQGQPGQQPPPYAGQAQQPGQPQWQGQPGQGAPQPGQQQWQGQGPYGAPQPGQPGGGANKKAVAAIIVVLLVVIGAVIAAVLLSSGDDDDDKSSSHESSQLTPVETVEALVRASEDGDCPGMQELMVNGDSYDCEELLGNAEDYELNSAKERSLDGDKAVVETEYTQNGTSSTEDFPLTKVDGVWLVDLGDEESGSDSGSSDDGGSDGGSTAQVAPANPSGSHPLQVMDDLITAIKSNDCPAAKELLLDPNAANCSEITRDDAENIEFASPTLVDDGGDTATVSADMTAAGSSVGTFTVELVKTPQGAWVVDTWRY